RVLTSNQTAGCFYFSSRWNDGLQTRALVAASHAMNFHGGSAPNPFHDFKRIFRAHELKFVSFLKSLNREAGIAPVAELLFGRSDNVIIETLNLHLAGRRIVKLTNKLHQFTNWISSGATNFTLVRVS